MAQEVAAIEPDAVVSGPDGFLRVDYARLGMRLRTWDEWEAKSSRQAAWTTAGGTSPTLSSISPDQPSAE
jgi:hypothetical protein